jgi:pimeloyl-ACP methyl ester carboxylesterase
MRFSHPEDLAALIKNHDFVLVGYRGVDGSVVLDCPEISQALSKPPGDLLSDVSLRSFGKAGAQCAARLQSEGVDLAGYTMTETIADMEAAREALGYDRINLLGASYGTRLAMIYEWIYPDSLQRVIMAAVNTPGHFIWEAETIDAQIEDYARLCNQDAGCSARTDDLAETMRNVSQKMPDRWTLLPIDEGTVKLFTFIMFNESIRPPGDPIGVYGPAAVDIWLSAADGDASGMALASSSMLRNMFLPNRFTWGHLLSIGGSTDEYLDPTRDFRSEFDPPDSILGSPMSLLIWGMGASWPTNLIPEEYLQIQPSDVETLLEAGSVDFLTPPQGAEELLPYLSNGELILLEEFGHGNTFWNSQSDARLHMLTTFYNYGEVDASHYTYQPMDFDVGRGWPGLTKTILVIVVVVPVLLVTLTGSAIYFVSRRKRRHRNKQKES